MGVLIEGAWRDGELPQETGTSGEFRRAGGVWEPGSRRWLIERRRLGPVIRALRQATDPLFRRSGIALD